MFAPAHVRICAGKYLVLGPGPKTKFLYLTPAYSFISPGPPPCGCLSQHVNDRRQSPFPFVDIAKVRGISMPCL